MGLRTQNNPVTKVRFSPDGLHLAVGCANGAVQLWDPADGLPHTHFEGQKGTIRSLAFSPDGQVLVAGSTDRIIHAWDMQAKELACFHGHTAAIGFLSFAADGRRFVSGANDQTARRGPWAKGKSPVCPATRAR